MSIFGNLSGLKSYQINHLNNLLKRAVSPKEVISRSLARTLFNLSVNISRELGVLINRKGKIEKVVVGENNKLDFPDFELVNYTNLLGYRFIHAHPNSKELGKDDISHLISNQLDMVTLIVKKTKIDSFYLKVAYLKTFDSFDKFEVDLDENFNFLEWILEQEENLKQNKLSYIDKEDKAIAAIWAVNKKQLRRNINELQNLAFTADVNIKKTFFQIRTSPSPLTLLGKGKIEEIFIEAKKHNIDLILFSPSLTPKQAGHISKLTDCKIVDRTMLILDIFANRATTKEGKLQVELAQLRYTLPRLVGKNNMMSRLMGGIGGRGPGETKLEIDRRRVRERIDKLNRKINEISKQRKLLRKRRMKNKVPIVAIVGYTNAGKSTLLNLLTGSDVFVENRLFATLEPRTRRVRYPEETEIIFTDTVGFIEELPSDLIKAFRATLEELQEADLLLHLVDMSDVDYEHKEKTVIKILQEMELSSKLIFTVYNKMDLIDFIPHPKTNTYYVSAIKPHSVETLVQDIRILFRK